MLFLLKYHSKKTKQKQKPYAEKKGKRYVLQYTCAGKKKEKNKKKKEKNCPKERKKIILKAYENSPLAHRLERAPYKGTRKVQPLHGLPYYARLVKRLTHRPLKAALTGSNPVPSTNASVVELVDTLVSGTSGLCRAGSSPAGCTIFLIGIYFIF